jgi:nucleoside-diphosphate-sugar epimerase
VIESAKNILITGITGLVGSFVAKHFLEAGYQVIGLKRDTSDLSLVKAIENKIIWHDADVLDVLALEKAFVNVQYVVHAAAVVSFAPRDKERMFKTNVEGTANVVNACLTGGIKKLCFVGSVAGLGRKLPNDNSLKQIITIDENATWEESPLNSMYAKSKYLAEIEIWRGFSEGLATVIVNPSLILGEADWTKSSTQLFKYIQEEHRFYPEGTLNYVDVQDVADCIFKLLNAPIDGERFILNAGSISYKSFFEQVAKKLNKTPPTHLISHALAAIIWRVEAVRSWFTGNTPLITKETALSSSHHFYYSNNKIKTTIDIQFKGLDDSLNRICKHLMTKYQ